MHPLDRNLESSFHHHGREQQVRRRSSLDNSCLASNQTLLMVLQDIEDGDYEGSSKPRRYSLNNKVTTTPTFLSDIGGGRKQKATLDELDLNVHSSVHSRTNPQAHSQRHSQRSTLDEDEKTVEPEDRIFVDLSAMSVASDLDYQSFCDASGQDLPNKEYLKTDLGASCAWSDDGFAMDKEDGGLGDEKLEAVLSEVIDENGNLKYVQKDLRFWSDIDELDLCPGSIDEDLDDVLAAEMDAADDDFDEEGHHIDSSLPSGLNTVGAREVSPNPSG